MNPKSKERDQALILTVSAIFERIPFTPSFMNWRKPKNRSLGQSLVEMAIALPVIIALFSGLIEFGFVLNYYLSLLDATRESARYFSNQDPFEIGNSLVPPNCNCPAAICAGELPADTGDADCDSTLFYSGATSMVVFDLQPSSTNPLDNSRKIILNPATDDVVVSVFRVSGPAVANIVRLPQAGGEFHLPGFANVPSQIDTTEISTHLISGAPKTGIVLVEVYYGYHKIMPWLTPFLPNPLMLHAYSMMPLLAAEPP